MPLLTSLGESGHRELYANNVYFFMTYGGHRIRCGITDQALEILEPLLDQTGKGRWLRSMRTEPSLSIWRAQNSITKCGKGMASQSSCGTPI
jgi:hypothetical protein